MADDKVIPFPHRRDDDEATIAKLQAQLVALDESSSRLRHYKLDGRTPVRVETLKAWTDEVVRHVRTRMKTGVDQWRVAETEVGDVVISTVFLGLDQRKTRRGPPLLFETMILGGSLSHFQNRCATWENAEKMHAEAVALVRADQLKVENN
jgi:hypothetical protein